MLNTDPTLQNFRINVKGASIESTGSSRQRRKADKIKIQDLSTSQIIPDVKDSQILKLNDVSVFGIKDYSGNVQSVYAIQTDNAIYTIDNSRIARIQSLHETVLFNYDNTNNHYEVLVVSKNNSYQIPATYNIPNVTFPTPVFELPPDGIVPDFFTGIIIKLTNKISGRLIKDATLQMNYFDANRGNKSSVMLNLGGGRYYVPLPTNDTSIDYYFDTQKLLMTITQQSDACIQLMQAYPISDMCSKVPDSIKSFCLLIAQEMTVKIPDTLRTVSIYISDVPLQARSVGHLSNFEIIAYVPGEESSIVPLNTNNSIRLKRQIQTTVGDITIDPNTLNEFSIQSSGTQGECNEQSVSGGDTPDDRTFNIGKSNTKVVFTYGTYSVKDKIDVYYMNQPVFSTGCVGASGVTTISLDGTDTRLQVIVSPNCAGETGTAWYYTIECLTTLICEDNVCYCGVYRRQSSQTSAPSSNGCGGQGSPWNFIVQPLGSAWEFTSACDAHDRCYSTCNKLRSECDNNFLSDMMSSCTTHWNDDPDRLRACQWWAGKFYGRVHASGASFFAAAQEEDCDCASKRRRRSVTNNNAMLTT
ncbi:unnamed protein product [Rotaria sp. Silwood1]|nr:unnamed protein product [Rotaria sp. Silwood1]CAF3619307.1 unnamed protein product [Rotaria sp. Silwood1]CAF3709694.1 unnamed protein product [Rotaria sp. Silwood1]CAF4592440.1 unnamed protein product [Rotaria sp. Silwood1]